MPTKDKIEEIREALKQAGRTGYGDDDINPEPQICRYVTVHTPGKKPVRHDLVTDEVEVVTLKNT